MLNRLDRLEREATAAAGEVITTRLRGYYCDSEAEFQLASLSRNHLRALIEVARAAKVAATEYEADNPFFGYSMEALASVLAPLLAEEPDA